MQMFMSSGMGKWGLGRQHRKGQKSWDNEMGWVEGWWSMEQGKWWALNFPHVCWDLGSPTLSSKWHPESLSLALACELGPEIPEDNAFTSLKIRKQSIMQCKVKQCKCKPRKICLDTYLSFLHDGKGPGWSCGKETIWTVHFLVFRNLSVLNILEEHKTPQHNMSHVSMKTFCQWIALTSFIFSLLYTIFISLPHPATDSTLTDKKLVSVNKF